MRPALLISLLLPLFATDVLAQRDGGRRRSQDVELDNFTFQRVEYAAPSLERVWAEYGIYLPKGYDDEANAKREYPWVIWLHGRNESLTSFQRGGARVLDQLRGKGEIPEMILVTASAGRRTTYFNGERDGDVEDLIVEDLVKAVEKKHRVSKQRQHRAVMGISVGGFGAVRLALKHPDVFGAVAAHSSAMFPADPADLDRRYQRTAQGLASVLGDPIDEKKWAQEVPTAMVAHIKPESLQGLRIYFDVGSRDRYGFTQPNVDFHEALDKAEIKHTFELVEGGGHSWGSGLKDESLENSFKFVGASFSGKAPADAGAVKNDKKK